MQVKKEEYSGKLYLMYQYSAGVLRSHTKKQRAERKNITSEAKREINKTRRKFDLMLLLGANFNPGRDLFVYLGWAHEPTIEEDKRAVRRFHRRMGALYEKLGITYKWIDVREQHNREGEPCRLHHHMIISADGRRMLGKIMECWGCGSVDVRMLYGLSDNFEDTCHYLLKERKPSGARAYSASRNLRRPPDPLRRKVPEAAAGEVPPGVLVVRSDLHDTIAGRYEIMVGKIIDEGAFMRYWDRAQADRRKYDEAKFWRTWAARNSKKSGGNGPAF